MARNKKKGGKTKKILFAVEIIVLLVFLAGFAVYGQLMSRMDKTNTQKLDTNKVQVNQEVQDSIDSETSKSDQDIQPMPCLVLMHEARI